MSKTNYSEERLDVQIKWYSTKASENKSSFHRSQITIIIIGVLIPVVNIIDFASIEIRMISAILGSIIVGITGIMQLKKYHENWIMYRSTEEAMKKEKYTYENSAGEYAGLSDEEKDKRIVENIESIISNQNVVFFISHKRNDS